MRAGVAGGVLSTLAVAGASGSANAAEPVTQTLELPTLTADLAAQIAQSADATQQAAANYELQAERDAAAAQAAKEAKADLAEAKKKAAEEKRKAEEAARKAAAERASRDAERAALSASVEISSESGSGSGSGSASASVGASAGVSTSTASGSAAAVVSFVRAQVGDAYVSGGTGPNSWDCSGLVQAAFRQVNIDLPRVSQAQSTAGTQVSLSNLQPGDILYWGGAGSAYHVGVYVGDGMFVGAQNPSTGVALKSLSYDPPSGAVRVL
jgi:cell wall-associated NlpC family hydrolase